MSGEPKPPYKNYEENQYKILTALKQLSEGGDILPSYKVIARRSGLSLNTIKRHYAKLDFGYVCKRERIHTPEVVEAIRETAKDGKVRAQKLYHQIMEGYVEEKSQKNEVIGDLSLNANISGKLEVTVKRGIIRSREDLEALQKVADVVAKGAQSSAPVPGEDTKPGKFDDILKDIGKDVPGIIGSLDTMIIFKS